jgi:predicted SnoaL-like aldol condensation-catalyzing enzyme
MVAVQSSLGHTREGRDVAGGARFDLFRVARGRIIEHWSLSENPTIATQ